MPQVKVWHYAWQDNGWFQHAEVDIKGFELKAAVILLRSNTKVALRHCNFGGGWESRRFRAGPVRHS